MMTVQNRMKQQQEEMKDTINEKFDSFHNEVSEIKAMLAASISK